MVFLLGTPELALPSGWADARARIDDGSFPAGYIVDLVSAVLALAWAAGLWFLLTGVLKQDESIRDESIRDESIRDESIRDESIRDESIRDEADIAVTGDGSEPDEPWYRQGPPIFDEPFSDEYPRVVVPPDDMMPDDGPQDSLWQPATMTADVGDPLGMLSPDAAAEDMVSDAEIIGYTRFSDPDEPPMIVPVRAYYFTRAEDTLRSISAQFLHTPRRWQELRSLNAASPGVAAVGPDALLPTGTALALPGDPLPWGKPDPVYLWTLAEKFLFTAWGREPTPEEVVPFWRGLTSGTQLEAGAPPARPESLAAPPPTPTEPPAPEVARGPAPTPTEPPAPGDFLSPPPPVPGMEPPPAPTDFQPPPPVTAPAYETPYPHPHTNHQSHPARIRTTSHPAPHTNHQSPRPHTNHQSPHPHTNHPSSQPPTNHQSPHPHTNPRYPQHTNQPPTNHQSPHPHTNPPYPQHTNQPPTNHQSPHPHTNPPYPQHTNQPPTNHQSPHPHTNPPYPQHTNQPPTNHQSPHPHTNPPYPHHTNHPRPHTNPRYPQHMNRPRPRTNPR